MAGGFRASLCLFISDFLDTQLPPETIIRVSVMFGERRPDAGDVTDIIQIQREGGVSGRPLIGRIMPSDWSTQSGQGLMTLTEDNEC